MYPRQRCRAGAETASLPRALDDARHLGDPPGLLPGELFGSAARLRDTLRNNPPSDDREADGSSAVPQQPTTRSCRIRSCIPISVGSSYSWESVRMRLTIVTSKQTLRWTMSLPALTAPTADLPMPSTQSAVNAIRWILFSHRSLPPRGARPPRSTRPFHSLTLLSKTQQRASAHSLPGPQSRAFRRADFRHCSNMEGHGSQERPIT